MVNINAKILRNSDECNFFTMYPGTDTVRKACSEAEARQLLEL